MISLIKIKNLRTDDYFKIIKRDFKSNYKIENKYNQMQTNNVNIKNNEKEYHRFIEALFFNQIKQISHII